ncbi:MAG: hypothetical protein ACXWUE_42315 [Polyangiales bacterium]
MTSASAKPFVGDFAVASPSDLGEIHSISLAADKGVTTISGGMYEASVSAAFVDNRTCIKAPCLAPEKGKWTITHWFDISVFAVKMTLRLQPNGKPARSYTASVANDSGPLTLTNGAGKIERLDRQQSCSPACGPNTHCLSVGVAGINRCVPDAKACTKGSDCVAPALCNADGICSSAYTPLGPGLVPAGYGDSCNDPPTANKPYNRQCVFGYCPADYSTCRTYGQ